MWYSLKICRVTLSKCLSLISFFLYYLHLMNNEFSIRLGMRILENVKLKTGNQLLTASSSVVFWDMSRLKVRSSSRCLSNVSFILVVILSSSSSASVRSMNIRHMRVSIWPIRIERRKLGHMTRSLWKPLLTLLSFRQTVCQHLIPQ